MRLCLLSLLAFTLVACDAGNRDDPGSDNRFPGPELTVVQPGPGQVLTIHGAKMAQKVVPQLDDQGNPVIDMEGGKPIKGEPIKDKDGKDKILTKLVDVAVPGLEMPKAFFDVRNLSPESSRVGDRVLFRVSDGRMQEVKDWSRPINFGEGQTFRSGTHLMVACVWSGERNAPYANPESVVVRRFHLGGETGDYDLWLTEGKNPRAPLLETGPLLFVTGPEPRVSKPRITFAFKGTDFGPKYRVAYRVDDGDWQHADKLAPIPLDGLDDGKHKVLVRLEVAHIKDGKTTWRMPPRPYFARNAASDEAIPGEFNIVEKVFTTE